MQIPRLPVSGENLKKYILDTLRGIIDYLKATRLVEGDGISIRETPSGVIVSATRRGTTSQGASGAAEYDPGIGITITGGTPGVPEKINANITGGTDISVTGGTNGNPLVISYTGGGGGGGGIGYPDYIALAGGTASNSLGTITDDDYEGGTPPAPTMPDDPLLGITHIIPVPAGEPIKYYSSASCLVRYAPDAGSGGHFYYDLSNELEWTPTNQGWLRVSILDDGTHASDCIRLYVGGEEWSDAVAMHKCLKVKGATGITSAVSGGTATVSLTGGTGSVKFTGAGSVSISRGESGEIVITGATSGGGGGVNDAVFISEEPSDATGQIAAQINKRYYIAVFGDLYYDNEEGYGYVCQYYTTYDYSTSPATITRHKTDYNDLQAYSEGYGYSLELVLPAPSDDCYIDICLFALSAILISSSKPIYGYQGSPVLQPYSITNRNVKLTYIANDHGGRWYLYGN